MATSKRKNNVRRFARPLRRTLSLGRGCGYGSRLATCSKCHVHVAYWLQKRGCFQRYFCDECVQLTAAWKEQEAAKTVAEA